MSTTETGRQAEAKAATFLQKQGYKIVQQNFKTRECEIDIVASKGNTVYFVEVKYRRGTAWGSGIEYVTPKKVQQMRFAATTWLHEQTPRRTCQVQLSAIEVSGADFAVTQWVEDIL